MAEAQLPDQPAEVGFKLGTAGAPPDLLDGSTVDVTGGAGDLQAAILGTGAFAGQGALNTDGTHKGNTYVCPAGAVYTEIVLPPTTGVGWTCIKSGSGSLPARGTQVTPEHASALFTVLSNGVVDNGHAVVIPLGSHGWRFIGLDATHPNANKQYSLVDVKGNRTIFERCYVHGHPSCTSQSQGFNVGSYQAGVWTEDFQLWDSWVSEAQCNDLDSQAVFMHMNRRAHVENCELQATGENIMIGTNGWGQTAEDLTFKRNHFFKPLRWRITLANGQPNPVWDGVAWTVKELFEIKVAVRLLLEGNILENNWGGQGQDGTASLASAAGQYVVRDVMYRSNTFMNCPSLFSLQCTLATPPPPERVAYLNNLGLNIGAWAMFFNHQSRDVTFDHNTVVPGDGVASVEPGGNRAIMKWDAPYDNLHQTIRRNVIGAGLYALRDEGIGAAMSTARANIIAPDRDWRENAIVHGTLNGALESAVAGFTSLASAAAAGVNLTDGKLAPTSPLRFVNGWSATDEKDAGVDFDALEAAQQGTATAPVAGMSAQQVAGTFGVNFTDASSGAPTSGTWDFGDGNTSTLLNHNRYDYAAPGTYTVTHTVQNSLGSDSITQDVVVVLAFGFVRGAEATVGAGQTTVPIQVAQINVGDLVIVSLNRCDAPSIDSMDDTLGNVYSPLSGQFSPILGGAYKSRTFYTVATAGGFNPVITGRLSGPTATFARILYREYACPHPIGLVGSNLSPPTTSGTPMNSGNVTVSKANSLLIGYHDFDFASTPTMPSGWTLRDERFTADRINVAAGTYAFQPTFTGTQGWIAQIAAFEFDAEVPTQVDVAGTDTL